MTEIERKRLTEDLIKRAPSMDLGALLGLLAHLGFSRDRILLRGHPSQASPQRLLERLSFRQASPRGSPPEVRPAADPLVDDTCLAVLELNLGLLSAQSPLPNYMVELPSDPRIDERALIGYLAFLDHMMLDLLFTAAEHDLGPRSTLHADGPSPMLFALSLDCPSLLHWLFSAVFPELTLRVRRASVKRAVPMDEFMLGRSALGEPNAFHGASDVATAGFEVELRAEDWRPSGGHPWSTEAGGRLRAHILPLLTDCDIALRVRLRFPGAGGAFQLGSGRPAARLGHAPFSHKFDQPIEIVLFDGSTLGRVAS